jgi:signal transduction histidine kinase
VKDRGIGIQAIDQERVFERFERAVPPTHFGGFGLGLWIVRHLVEAHGGTIRLESVAGEGTTVRVLLPKTAPTE